MASRFARPIAWLLLIAIFFVTVSPIEWRPTTSEPAGLERLFAFAVLGLAFAIGYPRHWILVACLVVGAAFASELSQLLSSTRHPRFQDAAVKALGGIGGALVGIVIDRLSRRWSAAA